jgi:DNA-binding NtrC family response regulator
MEPLRVLFVDDEEELVSAVVERLDIRGVHAVGATNGLDALKKVEEGDYDVVVLDVRMPGLGGLDVIRHLKRDHPSIEVVLLSGHGSKDYVEEGLSLGAFDYLQKPVDIEELVDILKRAASRG